ncbi:hypothetical protein PSTT_04037, partial [Puccinia striiformis]
NSSVVTVIFNHPTAVMPSNTNTVMPANQPNEDTQRQNLSPFDLVGIGFGPANLSLSVRESRGVQSDCSVPGSSDGCCGPNQHAETTLKACFIESNDCFRWHPGMLVSLASENLYASPPSVFSYRLGPWSLDYAMSSAVCHRHISAIAVTWDHNANTALGVSTQVCARAAPCIWRSTIQNRWE